MAGVVGHNISKLFTFMKKVVPDGEGVTFYDDGSKLTIQMVSSDALSVTAVMPSGGKSIAPVTLQRQDFEKAYRPNAVLSGRDGKLNMAINTWHMTLLGAVETVIPEHYVIEGKKLVADVTPLKSVPSEDSYGGSTWAMFLPSGMAVLTSTYAMVAIRIQADMLPRKPVIIQANAIYPLVNLVDPSLIVNDDAVGINGKFPVGNGVDAQVFVALSKPNTAAPDPAEAEAYMPSASHRLSVMASELRVCIEGAKKTFNDEATNLSFMLTGAGLSISLQSQTAALTETIPYIKKPKDASGKLNINTDVIVTAFKGLRELTTGKAVANIKWDENAVSIRIVEGGEMVGAIVIAAATEES